MFEAKTEVSFSGEKVRINNQPTYAGNPRAEGLLLNERTVNATFDDTLGKVNWWDDDGSHPENDYGHCWCSWRLGRAAAIPKWRCPPRALSR